MLELSLHVLDIVNNSVKAGASLIEITVNEDICHNLLTISIQDNGCGMDEEFLRHVLDPFQTTRTTRKVGMGLSLFQAAARACGGDLHITSRKGVGTTVVTTFEYNHIDRQPLGDMAETVSTVLSGNTAVDFVYRHVVNGNEFVMDTREIKAILGDVDIASPEIVLWIRDYIAEGIASLRQVDNQ